MPSARPTHRYLLWLSLLAAVVFVAFVTGWSYIYFPISPALTVQKFAPAFPKDAPAPTPADYISAQHGFQYLVSYTEDGFAPTSLSVANGETVRFTNNSSTALQLSFAGARSAPLIHGAYFEYTFTEAGTFTVTDSTPANSSIVTVK